MTDARFGPGIREVLTTPEHSMMMDTIEENLAKWIARFDYYKEQNEQAVIEAAEQGGQTARVLVALKATQIARRIVRLTEGFITLANEDNVSAAPAVVRALHETFCVTCYMAEEIVPRPWTALRWPTNEPRASLRLGCGSSGLRLAASVSNQRDIKQFRQACREVGLTASERYEASDALHGEKSSDDIQSDMTYGEPVAGCDNGRTDGDRRSPRCLTRERTALNARIDCRRAYRPSRRAPRRCSRLAR